MKIWRLLFAVLMGVSLSFGTAQAKILESNPTAAEVSTWNKALNSLFTDAACTELKAEFATLTTAQMQTNEFYLALPPTLQKMVLKMTTDGTWTEANGVASKPQWDAEYAKRFRVQLIEPYCNKEAAAQALGINAHTNLNNPLGIYANSGQTLFIMVEGEIKSGADLYLATWTGHNKPGNGYDEGTRLKEGLNAIKVSSNNLTGCINYVVHTMNSVYGRGNKACVRKLSDYDNLKIHIEGGYVNGFYNAVGDELWGEGDNNADWDYYAARAGQTDLTVLGKYITLQFPLFDDETEGNHGLNHYFTGKNIIEKTLKEWDDVVLEQLMLMGLASKKDTEAANAAWDSPYSDKKDLFSHTGNATDGYQCDYEEYYRVHALAHGVGGSSYMYGSWDHSGYHFNTMSSIMVDILNSAGSHWGPGHEIGHQHQGPLTLNGQTEVTNNLFANVALWCYGKSTSRVNGSEGSLENVAKAFNSKGGDFYTNNIWALTHMYYRLFCYYHVLGHNTEFYPRLYEMLRQDPMKVAYMQDGDKGLLHIYKKMCMAAGEDLTEFCRAHGMLTPMIDRMVGDYSNSIYNTTQAQIDAAIQEVKKMGFKENLAPLFINDGTGEKILDFDGKTRELYDGQKTADVGSYAHFYTPASEYTYKLSAGNINLTGTGGVGYYIKNDKGEIIAFSNKKKMALSEEALLYLVQGNAKVTVLNGDNTTVEATGDLTAARRTSLNALINKAEDMIDASDDTGTKVGFYKKEMMGAIENAAATAKEVYSAANEAQYAAVYEALFHEIQNLENNPFAVNSIIHGSSYELANVKAPNYVMSINSSSKKLTGEKRNSKKEAQKWIFERADDEGNYYIKNKITQTYLDELTSGEQGSASATTPTVKFKVISLGNGDMAVECQSGKYQSLNYNSSIGVLGWSYEGDKGSWWNITAVDINQAELDKAALAALVDKTKKLLQDMGDNVILPGALPLQADESTGHYYLSSNADQNVVGDATDGGGVAALLDDKTTTYFHSQWSGTPVKEDHYLQVDLGEGKELSQFAFSYATRKTNEAYSTSPAPTKINVTASQNGTKFINVTGNFSNTAGSNPLPSYKNLGVYWTSKDLNISAPCRYLRFTVKTSAGPGSSTYNGKYFFAMSEFSIIVPKAIVNSLKKEYAGAEQVYEVVANTMYDAYKVANNAQSTDEDIATALADLQEKYDALVAASKGDVGIENLVTPQQQTQKGIYDLSGRKIQQITQPGLYIIDGIKRFVK